MQDNYLSGFSTYIINSKFHFTLNQYKYILFILLLYSCTLQEYTNIGGMKVYFKKNQDLSQKRDSVQISLRAEIDKPIYEYGDTISLRIKLQNIGNDSVNVLPYAHLYMEEFEVGTWLPPLAIKLHVKYNLDVRKKLAPLDTYEYKFDVLDYKDILNVKSTYKLVVVYSNSIYRIDDDFFFTGEIRSNPIIVSFYKK